MATYTLSFTLRSDAIFGRGDGVAGLVHREVLHDPHGFPYLGGRSIKGMLTEECDLLLERLVALRPNTAGSFMAARDRLFGQPGSMTSDEGELHIGNAELPITLRQAVIASGMPAPDVLASLTTIRRQSAIDVTTGAPEDSTLRASRCVLRQTFFEAPLTISSGLSVLEVSLLAASVLHWRRAGGSRNRGRGRLTAELRDAAGKSLLEQGLNLMEVTV